MGDGRGMDSPGSVLGSAAQFLNSFVQARALLCGLRGIRQMRAITTGFCSTEKVGVSFQPFKVARLTKAQNQTNQKVPPALLSHQNSQARRPGSRTKLDMGSGYH